MTKEFKKGEKVKLSKNFWSDEFDCNCNYKSCKITIVDMELIKKLQEKRNEWKEPIVVISGFRCKNWNKKVGGSIGSLHMSGKAADIVVPGIPSREIANKCEDFTGLGRYEKSNFTHVDVRAGKKARWRQK